jgi:hypothetical protein
MLETRSKRAEGNRLRYSHMIYALSFASGFPRSFFTAELPIIHPPFVFIAEYCGKPLRIIADIP